MQKLVLGLAMALALSALAPVPAAAQYGGFSRDRDNWDPPRDYRDRDWNRDREWRRWRNYDWNRPAGRHGYWADDYYRDGRHYRPYRITRQTRLYRGRDGRYYCRRNDGTTGLVVGAAIGSLLGAAIDPGRSNLAGVLIGGSTGALLGREIDRGNIRCR